MEKEIKAILSTIDKAIDSFAGKIPAVQKLVYDELQPLIKELAVSRGKLLNNVQNLKLMMQIKAKLERLIVSPEYKSAVKGFIDSYSAIADLNQAYFTAFMGKHSRSKTALIIRQIAVESTINGLLGQGMQASIIDPISRILNDNITTGGSYARFQEELATHIRGNAETEGSLLRYTKQLTTDAIHQYQAQYHEAFAQDLKFNWGRYVGSNLTTTREFCELLTKKQWVHRTELPGIISGVIDGASLKLSKKSGLPLGMIPGTNADNFKVRRGGYNCGHQFFWVPDSAVPDYIRSRIGGKGPALKANFFNEDLKIDKKFTPGQLSFIEGESGLKYDSIVNLTGGIPGKDISNIRHDLFRSGTTIYSIIDSDQYRIERHIDPVRKTIYNNYMRVHATGGGLGLNLFLNQVREARNQGYSSLTVTAAGSKQYIKDWNGYVTWAKFGYEMSTPYREKFLSVMKQHGRKEKTLFELVSTKEGEEFWKEVGFQWHGTFNLAEGSQSIKNLREYLSARKINFAL